MNAGGEILGGYSKLPRSEYMIPYMNGDGSVDWNRLNEICQKIADAGASYVREFPYWPTGHKDWPKLAPFWMKNGKVEWNNLYFTNWTKIFKFIKEQYNLTPVFCLFNASETRVKGPEHHYPKENSPWKSFGNFFYEKDARNTRHEFIDRILGCAKKSGVEIWIELCNEPPAKSWQMMVDTFDYLVIKKGFPMSRVISGWDIYLKKRGDEEESDALKLYASAYRSWRNVCATKILDSGNFEVFGDTERKKLDYIKGTYLKGTIWTTFHGCKLDTVKGYFGPGVIDLTHRNQVYSTDASKNKLGDRLNYQDGFSLAKIIVLEKPNSIRKSKVFLSILVDKEADTENPYGSLEGACDCLENYGYFLENKGKYPEPLPLPDWLELKEEPPAPEPPPVKEPDIPIIYPAEKKGSWFDRHWRWVVGGASVLLAAGLIIFAPWYWRLVGAAQLYFLRHFRIIK